MTLLRSRRVYRGRVIQVDHDTVEFPDGSTGVLEMVRHPGAAAVVPLLDDLADPDPRVLLLRQFRHAANGVIWEVPAGTLEPGESPEACARRELEEEAGMAADQLLPLTTIYTTPGFTDERIHLFAALGLSARPVRPARDEHITVHAVRWSLVGQMIRTGQIMDGKSLVTLLFLQAFRRKEPTAGG